MLQKIKATVVWRTAGPLLLIAILSITACGGGGSVSEQDASPAPPVIADSTSQPAPAPTTVPNTTSAFGIPTGLTGTVAAGNSLWTTNCTACHGSIGARSFGQLESAMGISAMRSLNLSPQQLADLTAYLNRGSIPAPSPTPTPPATGGNTGGGDPPAPVPAPVPSPAPVTDTTTSFGIPVGLTGSVNAGNTVWSTSCTVCHGSMSAKSFGQLQSAMAISAMKSLNLSQQQLADLTAYLNRSSIQSTGTPPASTGGSGGSIGGDDDDDDDSDDDSSNSGDDNEGDDDEGREEEDD